MSKWTIPITTALIGATLGFGIAISAPFVLQAIKGPSTRVQVEASFQRSTNGPKEWQSGVGLRNIGSSVLTNVAIRFSPGIRSTILQNESGCVDYKQDESFGKTTLRDMTEWSRIEHQTARCYELLLFAKRINPGQDIAFNAYYKIDWEIDTWSIEVQAEGFSKAELLLCEKCRGTKKIAVMTN